MFKKILIKGIKGIIITGLLLGLIYFLILNYDKGNSIERIKNNLWYMVFVGISVFWAFIVYSSDSFDKNRFFFIILIINFLIGGFVFFMNQLGLSTLQIVIIMSIIILSISIIKIKNNIKYILYIIMFCIFCVTISISFINIYRYPPNINDFLNNRGEFLSIYSEEDNNGLLIIQYPKTKKEYKINKGEQKIGFIIDDYVIMSFASKKKKDNSKVEIELSNGSKIKIYPQSYLKIKFEEKNKYSIQDVVGEIEYYVNSVSANNGLLNFKVDKFVLESLSNNYINIYKSGTIFEIKNHKLSKILSGDDLLEYIYVGKYGLSTLDWNYYLIESYSEKDFVTNDSFLDQKFEQELEYFIRQELGTIQSLPSTRKIIGYYLKILFGLDQKKFGNYIINFNQYGEYIQEKSVFDSSVEFIDDKNINYDKNKIIEGVSQTRSYKIYNDIKKIIKN